MHNRMHNRTRMLAAALAALACAKADKASQDSTSATAVVAATPAASANAAAFDKPYIAKLDTQWSTCPNVSPTTTGPIAKGTTVLMERDPDPMASWTTAKVPDVGIRCVRPSDFEKAKT